jgi:hypothetical protein
MSRPELAELGLVFALLAGGVLLLLSVGWSVQYWLEARVSRAERVTQRLLLAQLYELEMTCGVEFPQVQATVNYVRALVLGAQEEGVVTFRARLRTKYGRGPWREDPCAP